jgi:FecR protein
MKRHILRFWTLGVIGLLVLWVTSIPVNAQSEGGANAGRPGSINYIEGQVSIGTQVVDPKSVGSAVLEAGQSIMTEQGKAEILLTPGAFLRLGDNTSVKMISPDLTNIQVEVQRGHAIVEVTDIYQENNLRVDLNGATTQLLKTGLYDFDADRNLVRVFYGKADVEENGRQIEVNDGRELYLNAGGSLKAKKFDKKTDQNDLYSWSSLRAEYLARANADAAQIYVGGGGGWIGAGWYWDPWYDAYTFIPGGGYLYSPFGFGFYSPGFVFLSPFIGFGHFHHSFVGFRGRGFVARGFHGHGFHSHGFHGGGFHGGGFHGHGFHGGEFHGGGYHGGGFHNGGYHGGGFHGGGYHGGEFHGGGFHNGGYHGGGFHGGGFHGGGGFGGGGFHGGGFGGGGFHGGGFGGGGFHGGGRGR